MHWLTQGLRIVNFRCSGIPISFRIFHSLLWGGQCVWYLILKMPKSDTTSQKLIPVTFWVRQGMQTSVWAALGSTHTIHSSGLNSRPLSSIEFNHKRNKAVSRRGEEKGKNQCLICFPKLKPRPELGSLGRNFPVWPPHLDSPGVLPQDMPCQL